MKYIDTHCHLNFSDYGKDQKEVLERMKKAEVGAITVGTDLKSSAEAVALAEANDNIWASIGVHPKDDPKAVFDEQKFAELVQSSKVVSIGECGLDYFKMSGDIEAEKARQKELFVKQIEFSIKYDKPLMLHIREAYDDAYEILKKYPKARGNLHFFTASSAIAKKFIDLGYTVSFPGVITFAKETEEAVKHIPLDKMHAETDSPFAAPMPYRGKRNEPSYVIETVKKIAELRNEDFEKVRKQLLENATIVFNIKI
jgi:TatD DNase family protein